ncbi:MAG TPA: hypothetical protein VFU27_08890 [Terriglobales bacterium]|nr:hypothetical protein [Terriglobales bacterium]
MSDVCKATITYGDVKIVLEGPKAFIEEQIAKHAPLASSPKASKQVGKPLITAEHSALTQPNFTSERDLIGAKQPRGHHEIVAVLAYSLTEAGQKEFGEDEIRRAYIRAGVRPPKVVAQALRDAKNGHDFLESAGRGRYRLSAHGDRTVRFDLPRREGD